MITNYINGEKGLTETHGQKNWQKASTLPATRRELKPYANNHKNCPIVPIVSLMYKIIRYDTF